MLALNGHCAEQLTRRYARYAKYKFNHGAQTKVDVDAQFAAPGRTQTLLNIVERMQNREFNNVST